MSDRFWGHLANIVKLQKSGQHEKCWRYIRLYRACPPPMAQRLPALSHLARLKGDDVGGPIRLGRIDIVGEAEDLGGAR